MPNNNNQPDINKAIDVCMEEYKTLRTEILQTVQNRSNVIVFGGGLVLTLLGIGISPIANLPIMKETTTVTETPNHRVEHKRTDQVENNIRKVETTWITEPTSKGNLVIKEKDTATETISPQKYDIPIERRIPSAIILGIMVPASCGLIIFLVNASNHQVVRIGRYIATNIEPKINDLYFNNLPVAQKPIVWETYMQTLRFGPEEGTWIKSVFGTIQLLGLAGAVFAVVDIWIWIICILVLLLIPTKTRKIISHMYFSIFTEDSKEIAALRDGEGSLKKIWYKGIDKQNEDVKSTRIFWIKPIRYFIPLYQIVVEMIDDRTNAIIEIENDSLKSRLQTLGEFDLANQVQKTKDSMQAQGADKQYLLNKLINNCFKNLLNKIKNYIRNTEYNPPFYFNLDKGRGKRINNIPELLELCIDNPNKFKEHMDKGDFERWLDNIEIGETELANIAQATREKNDNERLHYFLRECCLVLIGRNP
ncbi:hypothetical protein [Microcystis aeruginosa]|uniref:hypothetical protein n=1 Tax=Microcystis aeruginosa TaxID=1126 RepID=UPI00287F417C|nr:hypothetical protein [Microcystis aeruginosa]WNF15954.1 hypothetical protein RKE53_06060 [Microcystis aeruginosa NRERC-214]